MSLLSAFPWPTLPFPSIRIAAVPRNAIFLGFRSNVKIFFGLNPTAVPDTSDFWFSTSKMLSDVETCYSVTPIWPLKNRSRQLIQSQCRPLQLYYYRHLQLKGVWWYFGDAEQNQVQCRKYKNWVCTPKSLVVFTNNSFFEMLSVHPPWLQRKWFTVTILIFNLTNNSHSWC